LGVHISAVTYIVQYDPNRTVGIFDYNDYHAAALQGSRPAPHGRGVHRQASPCAPAQLNKAQKSNSDLKHATTVCGRLQHHCGASVVVEESGVPGGAAAPHTRVATRSAIS